MSVNAKNTEIALKQFINEVVSKSRSNLVRKGKNASGNLSKSISGSYKVSANSFMLSFEMEDYGTFQDLGVKGATSSKKAPNSPYRMGTGTAPKGLFKTAINAWVVRKGIAPRANGKFTGKQVSCRVRARKITPLHSMKIFKVSPIGNWRGANIGIL